MMWWIALIAMLLGGFILIQSNGVRFAQLFGLTLFIIGAVFSIKPAFGHDHARPELAPWFKSLTSKAKDACCDGSDATRLDDVDWETKDGRYRVRIYGEWVDVPESAVIDGPNLAGPAMVWPLRGYMGLTIRCFMPGMMG